MKRRQFLTLVPFAALPLDALAEELCTNYMPHEEFDHLPDWPEPHFDYKGYRIFWTGWKCSQGTREIAGQWVAYPHVEGKDPYLVVNLPNCKGGITYKFSVFDISYNSHPPSWEMVATKGGRLQLIKRGSTYIQWLIDHKNEVNWTQWDHHEDPDLWS